MGNKTLKRDGPVHWGHATRMGMGALNDGTPQESRAYGNNTTTRKNNTMITVNTRTDTIGCTVEYPTATKWHTDDDGVLHVIQDGKGNIGAHARGTWAYVKHEPPTTRNAIGDPIPAVESLSPEFQYIIQRITDALKNADEGELYEDADGLFRLGIKRKK